MSRSFLLFFVVQIFYFYNFYVFFFLNPKCSSAIGASCLYFASYEVEKLRLRNKEKKKKKKKKKTLKKKIIIITIVKWF